MNIKQNLIHPIHYLFFGQQAHEKVYRIKRHLEPVIFVVDHESIALVNLYHVQHHSSLRLLTIIFHFVYHSYKFLVHLVGLLHQFPSLYIMVKKICITSLKVTVGKSEKNFVPHGGKAPVIPSFPPHGGKAPVIPSFFLHTGGKAPVNPLFSSTRGQSPRKTPFCSTFSKSGFSKSGFFKSGFLKGMVYNNQGINNGKSSLTKVACPSRDQ